MITKKHQRRNFPIDVRHEIFIDLSFNEEQYQKLILGLSPKEMDNRWRIKFENDTLFFQRSWTGYTIFEAKILKENDRYFINSFCAERNPDKYKITDDTYDIEAIIALIDRLLSIN